MMIWTRQRAWIHDNARQMKAPQAPSKTADKPAQTTAGTVTHLITATREMLGIRTKAKNTIVEEFLDARAKDVALIRADFARKDLESAMHGMQCQIDEWKMFLAATKSAVDRRAK